MEDQLFGLCIIFITLPIKCAQELAWTAQHYPSPNDANDLCNNYDNPYMCDPDQVFDFYDKFYMNEQLSNINSNTNCDCFNQKLCSNLTNRAGYTLGIAVVNRVLNYTHGGNRNLLPQFAHAVRTKWSIGNCADDALILLCKQCDEIILDHGDLTERKIPDSIRLKMETTGTQLLTFTNHTIVLEYLLTNYHTLLTNHNGGVITVMILTSLLAVAWVTCVAYLLIQGVCRQHLQRHAHRNVAEINVETSKRIEYEDLEYGPNHSLHRPHSLHIPNSPDLSAKGPLLMKYLPAVSPKHDLEYWRWRSHPTIAASDSQPPQSVTSNAQTVETALIGLSHSNGTIVSIGALSAGNDREKQFQDCRKSTCRTNVVRRVVSFDSHVHRSNPKKCVSRAKSQHVKSKWNGADPDPVT